MELHSAELITCTMVCNIHLSIHWDRYLASPSGVLMQVHLSDADSMIRPPESTCETEKGFSALDISEYMLLLMCTVPLKGENNMVF